MIAKEKEELVRRFIEEAWRNRDLPAALECAHPDLEIDWSASMSPFKDIYRGHEGLERFWRTQLEGWDEFVPQVEESFDCGPDRLITDNLIRARGQASGIEITSRGVVLWTFRDGRIAGGTLFQTRDEALEAVGLTTDARFESS